MQTFKMCTRRTFLCFFGGAVAAGLLLCVVGCKRKEVVQSAPVLLEVPSSKASIVFVTNWYSVRTYPVSQEVGVVIAETYVTTSYLEKTNIDLFKAEVVPQLNLRRSPPAKLIFGGGTFMVSNCVYYTTDDAACFYLDAAVSTNRYRFNVR